MFIYIALLRGINVGGKNVIRMADLKSMCEEMGLKDVKTYIQSGNVLFKSDETEAELTMKLEEKIKDAFGFFSSVIIRTSLELENIISNCPFSDEEIKQAEEASGVESLYVALLKNAPSEDKKDILNQYTNENDKYLINNRDVFLLFTKSIRNSKLAGNLHKLDVTCTVRNMKTMKKLLQLSSLMQA